MWSGEFQNSVSNRLVVSLNLEKSGCPALSSSSCVCNRTSKPASSVLRLCSCFCNLASIFCRLVRISCNRAMISDCEVREVAIGKGIKCEYRRTFYSISQLFGTCSFCAKYASRFASIRPRRIVSALRQRAVEVGGREPTFPFRFQSRESESETI